MKIYRQGDVLLIEDHPQEKNSVDIPRDQGRIVLARGEVTGHAHVIAEHAVQFWDVNGVRFVDSPVPFAVVHEEHAPITVPAGTFRVVIQREYAPGAIRNVSD